MDPNVFTYAQIFASAGSQPFFQVTQTFRRFATVSGDRNGTGDTTRTRARCRGIQMWEKVSQKKDTTTPRRKGDYLAWTKDEEYALARAWLDISETPDIRETFFKAMGKEEDYCKVYSISSKYELQEALQRNWDNRESGQNDANVITRALEEYNVTKGSFTYLRCRELLRRSPKWANVPTMTSSVRSKSKRSKTSSSVDSNTPTSDACNVNLNIIVDNEEDLELERPSDRRSAKNKRKKKRSPLLLITKY
ncbi:putative No apical meristem-associated domain-containing protein [Helianthus annuus]|nr:putative No apical meristem-associated domain-containing protein [Helianthus annuus]